MDFNTQTRLCGIIGYPLEHSMSPAIHNAAAQYHKINAVFLAFPTQNAKGALQAMRTLNLLELTVTMPLKEKVIPYLDGVDKQAKELGNVNTIINRGGRLIGYNTDIYGLEYSLKGLRLKAKPVVLLGAGGVARTVAYTINKRGGQLFIFNRDIKPARQLAKRYQAYYDNLQNLVNRISKINPYLIINATPVGMGSWRGQSLLPASVLKSEMVVFDLIYNPPETRLIKDAKRRGCQVITGVPMFIGQGARQFELWSKKKAPWRVMEQVFKKRLGI